MRLLTYLGKTRVEFIDEAQVKTSNADSVFRQPGALPFMWSPQTGLIYAKLDPKTEETLICKNDKVLERTGIRKKIMDKYKSTSFVTHEDMVKYYLERNIASLKDLSAAVEPFIRGRISGDRKTIYIHDLEHRTYKDNNPSRFQKDVDKTVDKVYKYMGELLK